MNLQRLKLSERRHTQKIAYSMIPIILYFHYGIGTNIGRGLNVCQGLIVEGSNWQKNPQGNFWRCWEYSTYNIMVVVVIIYLNCTFNIFDLKKYTMCKYVCFASNGKNAFFYINGYSCQHADDIQDLPIVCLILSLQKDIRTQYVWTLYSLF